MNFVERERGCEIAFEKYGPFWHICTPGNQSGLIFRNEEDFKFGMVLVASCAAEFPEVIILSFELMSDHVHFVLASSKADAGMFFERFKSRLLRYCSGQGRADDLKNFNCTIIPIKDLKTLRNTMVYCNRNGYVINPSCTPYSYRWGTGRYFYNELGLEHKFGDLTVREKRALCHSRDQFVPDEYLMDGDYPAPVSFCRIDLAQNFFRDAHQYFSMLSKNVEAYKDIAMELGDKEFITDDEMFAKVIMICKDKYGVSSPKDLRRDQKIDFAKILHYEYGSGNNQIRRMLLMTQYEIDSLFPLSVSKK